MSTLSQFGSGVKSIQTGFVYATGTLVNSGEDGYVFNVTVSPITNTAKCVILFSGAATSSTTLSVSYNSSTILMSIVTARVLNSTTIRLSSASNSASTFLGRWTLVEYN